MDGESAKRWAKAADLAAPLGLLTAAQLNALGIFRGAIEKGPRSGRLHRVHQGVLRARPRPAIRGVSGGRRPSWPAVQEAVLSHRSAAAAWGIRDWESRSVDVTSPSGPGESAVPSESTALHSGEVDQIGAVWHPGDFGRPHGRRPGARARRRGDLPDGARGPVSQAVASPGARAGPPPPAEPPLRGDNR